MPSQKVTIAVIAGSVVAVGAVAFYLVKRQHVDDELNDNDDVFTAPIIKKTDIPKNVSPNGSKKPEEEQRVPAAKVASQPVDNTSAVAMNDLLAEALRDMALEKSSTVETKPATEVTTTTVIENNRKDFSHLGVSIAVPDGWEIREDASPFPNMVMLTLWNQELAADNAQFQQPGAVPMIVLSVEDIRGDNVNVVEFKDRSKDLAINQMLMMTGGAIEPKVKKDKACSEGPFRHTLEYMQSLPPFYELVVLNLLEVRHGVAYTFQIMCAPTLMPKYRNMFMDVARGIRINNITTSLGHVELHTGAVKVNIDTTWTWEFGAKDGALAVFTTLSSLKNEEIRLYAENTAPTTPHKPRNEKVLNGVKILSAFDGTQEQKTFTYNGYKLVVKPLQKAVSFLKEETLVSVIKSVSPSAESPKPKEGGTFVNPEHGYKVDIVGSGRLLASRIGGGTVAYAPRSIKEDAPDGEQPPTVTIRVATPETDPDSMESLDDWEARMKEEAKENDIKDIRRTSINNVPCLFFVSNTMEEVGPGRTVRIHAKIYVFVHDRKTTLVRWEMERELWRKFEREMNTFMESLQFI